MSAKNGGGGAGDAGGDVERPRSDGRGEGRLEPTRLIVEQWVAATMAASIVVRGSSGVVANLGGLARLSVDENARAAAAVVRAPEKDLLPLLVEVAKAGVRRGVCRGMLVMRMMVEVADEACYPIVRQWGAVPDRLDRILSP